MSELRLTVVDGRGARDVVVDAAPAERLAAVLAALDVHGRVALERTGARLDGALTLADAGLLDGDRLVESPSGAGAARGGALELVVAGGPAAGERFALTDGVHAVGRDGACEAAVDDPALSRRHFELVVAAGAVSVRDAGSANGTLLEDRLLPPDLEQPLAEGTLVRAGRSHFVVRRAPEAARSAPVAFNRPPRVTEPFEPRPVELPAPPSRSQRARLPLASALVPLVLGAGLYLATRQATMLLFAAMAPVMAVVSFAEERRAGRRGSAEQRAQFERRDAEAQRELLAQREHEATRRRGAAPDPAELADRALHRLPRLWERRPRDADFLRLRLGLAAQPSLVALTLEAGGDAAAREAREARLARYADIPSVPVVASLADTALALAGDPAAVHALARWIAVQLLVLHSPSELAVAAAVSPERLAGWEWLKWAPHVRAATSPLAGDHLAGGPVAARALVRELLAVVEARAEEAQGPRAPGRPPRLVVLLDEAVAPERALVGRLLADGPAHGVHAVWIGEDPHDLPGEAAVIAQVGGEVARLDVTDARSGTRIADGAADGVSLELAERVARALAPVRDIGAAGARGAVPARISLLQVLDLPQPSAAAVAERWGAAAGGLAAPVGATASGPLELDLREVGPHGLVGGTTGAGKSELLQSLVAALAATHPPERLTFLLIDYKGGAAFKDCVALPHTVGFVTDLDDHLTGRALTSLNAELRHREGILREHGAKDLLDLERRAPAAAPPSLLIVIDEFATLVKEVPDFVDGVVDVAQRGRSLGVHLLLATQRPGGVVSENIRANTNLRIALRMSDGHASEDVVGVPDAARIPRSLPGRAYVRVGPSELTEFQAAFAGAPVAAPGDAAAEIRVRPFGFGAAAPAPAGAAAPRPEARTELQALAEAVADAHARGGGALPRPPWLAPLPEAIALEALGDPLPGAAAVALVGLADEPHLQRQRVVAHDFDADGSLIVYGAGGSGKTTLLRTLAVGLAHRLDPQALHLYGLDFAGRGLSVLEALPQCGSVVGADDAARVDRLFRMLAKLIARRRDLLAAHGAYALAEYERAGAPGGPLPRVVVLLDGYAAFAATYERVNLGELVDLLPRLVSDGRALGLSFAITAERRAAIPAALGGIVPERIVLRAADADELAALGVDARAARGARLAPGRGFRPPGLELQVAVPGGDPAGEAQAAAIARAGEALAARFATRAPRVGTLPTSVPRERVGHGRPLAPVLGLGDDELEPVAIDLADAHFLVVGPYRSGRSSALEALAVDLRAAQPDVELHLLAPRRSPLPDLDLWTEARRGADDCQAAIAGLLERVGEPLVVVLDDADEIADSFVSSDLETLVRRARDGALRIVAAAETQAALRAFGGILRELRKEEHGLLLAPDVDVDGDILGVRLPRGARGPYPPGRGFLVRRGQVELVQVTR